jgi:hypothetical protein
MLVAFPLLIIPVALYNMIAFLTPPDAGWMTPVTTVRLVSGQDFTVTFSDALIGFALVMLLFEIIKAVRPGTKSVIDHLLSVLVFAGVVAEFVLVDRAATSTFAVLGAICLVDAVGGIAISVRLRRNTRAIERPIQQSMPVSSPPQPEPREPVRPAFSPLPDKVEPDKVSPQPTP